MGKFDFDEWARLARTEPDTFERRRRAEVEAFISAQAGARRERLRRLQWRIDRERERSPNAMAACVRLSNMMWDRFAGAGGLADHLRAVAADEPPPRPRKARILRFPPR